MIPHDSRLRHPNWRPKAILFDVGMTIIHPSGELLAYQIQRVVPEADTTPIQAARALALAAEAHHYQSFAGDDDADCVGRAMAHALGLPSDAGIEAWRAASASVDLYSILDPGTKPLLQTLHCLGVKTAAVSNALNCLQDELDSFGLLHDFDAVVGSNEGYHDKPSPEMFNAALHKLAHQPCDTWFVGDGLINDILGASRAGIAEQILVDRYGIYTNPPCPTIASMRELQEVVYPS